MIERILVPTDSSAESAQAVPIAMKIARAQGAEVLLLQVLPYPLIMDAYTNVGPDVYQQVLDAAEEEARENLARLEAQLTDHGVRVGTTFLHGNVDAVLIDTEREQNIDLVIMGTHGRSGLARFALGSVADRMVREGTKPVLLARAREVEPALKSALLMLDGSGVAEEAVSMAKTLAGRPIEHLILYRAVDDPSDRRAAHTYLEGVSGHLAGEHLEIDITVEVGDPTVLIRQAAKGADLVVLSTHGRGGFDRFRHGSVADRVVREAEKPVLLVRAGTTATAAPDQKQEVSSAANA
jgi:nucleotide-binding universal stress UspA family protein